MALTAAGCSGPMSTLDPAGPSAAAIAQLWWIMLAGAAAILALVLGLLALSFRPPRQSSERLWLIGGGIVFPLTVLTALLVAGIVLGERSIPARTDALEVTAEASQYRWRFSYPTGAAPTDGILHIPAGEPVTVAITTTDVIHSFWVPRLGGKMDAVPGHVNRLTIEASAPGTYLGICAEYCGTGHARHGFRVVAHAPPQWRAFNSGGAQ
ncbi:cytochrome c oxidase subunit II [Sphingomonas mucosissima]|uniref:Cytochrome aa3 subunit 2 n=1 Tax=Sphingomonas mucosissima TaxID=370959 RepID=A0A245ZEY5_9SPHN|nr:cytochrome c oxidase subunit II [Sphingomonas mucosissima]OWK28310.1 cytochrome c oxidase subunit 2 precursor [Sphingomonas mucosissima]